MAIDGLEDNCTICCIIFAIVLWIYIPDRHGYQQSHEWVFHMTPEDTKEVCKIVEKMLLQKETNKIINDLRDKDAEMGVYTSFKFLMISIMLVGSGIVLGILIAKVI